VLPAGLGVNSQQDRFEGKSSLENFANFCREVRELLQRTLATSLEMFRNTEGIKDARD
jgi:hypothetical protein